MVFELYLKPRILHTSDVFEIKSRHSSRFVCGHAPVCDIHNELSLRWKRAIVEIKGFHMNERLYSVFEDCLCVYLSSRSMPVDDADN